MSVLISIKPEWCELIANGKKTIEVRKTKPCLEKTPFKCYIYCSEPKRKNDLGLCSDNGDIGFIFKQNYRAAEHYDITILSGKVIGEFVCDRIISRRPGGLTFDDEFVRKSCLSVKQLADYAPNKPFPNDCVYGWHISNLKIYDKPRELSDFRKYFCIYSYDEISLALTKCRKECKACQITRPPQSWCYVNEVQLI